jgi:hypothetical protein
MSGKLFLGVAAGLALTLLAPGAGPCRADEFDDLQFRQLRQREDAQARALRRDSADAVAKARSLARSSPTQALRLLRETLTRLRDDDLLPRAERRDLISQAESCLREVKELVAANKPTEGGRARRQAAGAGGGGAAVPASPAVSGGGRPVRGGANGPSGSPLGLPAVGLNTTVQVPDGGTAVAGGYSRYAEARNEFGPPGLSRIPYASRLFKNVGYGRDVGSFRVLIGVRVISLREEEERFLGQAPAR